MEFVYCKDKDIGYNKYEHDGVHSHLVLQMVKILNIINKNQS